MKKCPNLHSLNGAFYAGLRKPSKFEFKLCESNSTVKEEDAVIWAYWCSECDDYFFERELLGSIENE